jgi:concanavalin A-like lectin/glucanase superfamily protein/BNR/Asp-box repeat protein
MRRTSCLQSGNLGKRRLDAALQKLPALALCALAAGGAAPQPRTPMSTIPDSRHIANGLPIPGESYCDQPYIVQTDDGAWLCAMTTAAGHEGSATQTVITVRSTDRGRTWSKPVRLEPAGGPEASYAVLLKVPVTRSAGTRRVYCFYNHNTNNVREVKREDSGVYTRVDTLGHYVFKYSDDHGRSWSTRRYEVPVREFEVDRKNIYGGKIRFFWNVGRPLLLPDAALLTLHKVGAFGQGFMTISEGVFMKSRNILTERDPEKLVFETLPEGDAGLRAPKGGGLIAEEQSVTVLSDGSLYCVYRTVDGYPACAYSRDGGRTWSEPAYATYTPGGKRIKHPRAANFAWRCSNGKFLYWFHNHGGPAARRPGWDPYADRNPAWLCAGEERDSPQGKVIHWSQPEILLYDDDSFIRMSYPDLVEEDGRFWITETQKNAGRVHELDRELLEGLFGQLANRTAATEGLLLDLPGERRKAKGERRKGEGERGKAEGERGKAATTPMPRLPAFHQRDNSRPDYGRKDLRAGFSVDLWLRLETVDAGQVLLDSRTETGQGLLLATAEGGALRLTLNDGREESGWSSDAGLLQAGKVHHVAAIVDGGPKIITWVIDGVLNDGGEHRQFGWGRFSPTLRDANGAPTLRIGPSLRGEVCRVRIYGRALRTSEAVGNYRAGAEG